MPKYFLKITISLVLLVGINWATKYLNIRFDFTQEKRYTISEASKNLAQNLDQDLFVKVYLTSSDLPGGFKRLQQQLDYLLADFKERSNGKIRYKYIDLYDEYPDENTRNEKLAELARKGLPPTNINESQEGKKIQKLVVPGLVISNDSLEKAVLLLKGNRLASPQEILNQSVEGMEFEIASAIKSFAVTEKKKIGFFINQTSLPAAKQIELIKLLKPDYDLYPVDLAASTTLEGLDAIFVLKPEKKFNQTDLFKIDQFIVRGGKALFFVDAVKVDTVSLEQNFANVQDTGLEPLLFNYGVRLNANLVKDYQMSAAIPLATGNMGNQANIQLVPWPYYPLAGQTGNSPIVRNLDAVLFKYPSTIDTVKSTGIIKTPLLVTSAYTQTINAPASIAFNIAAKDFDPQRDSQGSKVLAYLLQGTFTSYFKNTILPSDTLAKLFKTIDKPSQIVVVGSSSVALNDLEKNGSLPLPMGYDKYARNTFANADFIKNSVDYLLDDSGIILSRNKAINLRPLDKIEVRENKTFWQALNILVPTIILLLAMAGTYSYYKNKYARR